MAKVASRALLLGACVVGARAEGFLVGKGKQEISTDDVQETLQSLLLSTSSVELKTIEDTLRPMFVALPKNEHGALDHATVRYALHRYFVQRHGWYMNGLDLQTDGRNAFAPTLMKDRAPSFIQGVLEQRLHGEGLGLHDLAVFAATLSNLVHQEAVGSLQRIFDGMDFPTEGEIPGTQSEVAVMNFVVRGLLGLGSKIDVSKDLTQFNLRASYPDWDALELWVTDFVQTRDMMSLRNPFLQQSHSFGTTAALVEDISQNYGKYQKLECMSLKSRLVEMDQHGTGRVPLRAFYAGYQENPGHHFAESVDYLRNLGALDDTDPQRLTVMIPNYMNSKTNCLANSGFYAICCSNECEGLLRHVEESVASASAPAARIADVISALSSDTVDAPRNLSSTLRSRLEEVAQQNGGEVPLHGRLFSQWMHHAYPRECPFPHVSGTTTPLSPGQWEAQSGQSDLATMEEVGLYMGMGNEEAPEELPWTSIEELVTDVNPSTSRVPAVVRGAIALTAIASVFSSLVQAAKIVGQPDGKVEKFMV